MGPEPVRLFSLGALFAAALGCAACDSSNRALPPGGSDGGPTRPGTDAAVAAGQDALPLADSGVIGGGQDANPSGNADAAMTGVDAASGDGAMPMPDGGPADNDSGMGMPPDAGMTTPGRSAGCGRAGPPTGLLMQSLDVNGNMRTYLLAVPANYNPNTPIPLYFSWHGGGGSGAAFRPAFGQQFETRTTAIFAYPDGQVVPQGMQGAGATGWIVDPPNKDFDFFDAMYAYVTNNYCVDTTRVFSFGFSFGGFFTNQIGCFRSNVVRASAAVEGGGPRGTCLTTPVAAWMHNNDGDPVVTIDLGRASRDHWVMVNGCNANQTMPFTPGQCVQYQGCQNPVVWCEYAATTHDWGPDTAPSMLQFFLSF